MSRNVRAAAIALAMAGGVYLVGAAPAEASNMGFKLERSFDLIRRADGRPLGNKYWLSRPLFDGVGDVANTAATNANKCVGDADGPAAGDGLFNADDAICEMYTARLTAVPLSNAGTFTMSYYDRDSCTKLTRSAQIRLGTAVAFTGLPNSFPLVPDIGYEIEISHPAPSSPTAPTPSNRAVIVGSHDPSFPGRTIYAAPICTTPGQTNCCGPTTPRYDLVSLPYHTMYQRSFEILCGLEGVDWFDNFGPRGTGAPDGLPDTCWEDDPPTGNANFRFDAGETPTGVFDGLHIISVETMLNTLATSGVVTHSVNGIGIAGLSFSGLPFDLVPGDAYRLRPAHVTTQGPHNPTTFLSPHF